jgi:hypothetical protein
MATRLSLLASVLISIQCSGIASYYGTALLLNRKLGTYYRLQIMNASVRLATAYILYKTSLLSGTSAVWANTLTMAGLAFAIRGYGKRLIDEPSLPNRHIERQMFQYILPNLPSIVFFALQGQIAVFLIATFGQGQSLAQVSALSRLGQIFTFLGAFNPVVLEPWLARTPRHQLVGKLTAAMAVAVVFAGLIVTLAIVAPGAFLLLLGSRYSNMRAEVSWVVAASCISYVASVVWTASSASRFIFWHSTCIRIVTLTAVQVIFIVYIGVSTPLRAVQFGLCSSCAALAMEFYNLVSGLIRGPRMTQLRKDGSIAPAFSETAV